MIPATMIKPSANSLPMVARLLTQVKKRCPKKLISKIIAIKTTKPQVMFLKLVESAPKMESVLLITPTPITPQATLAEKNRTTPM